MPGNGWSRIYSITQWEIASITLFTDGERTVELLVHELDDTGSKSRNNGVQKKVGKNSNNEPLLLEFKTSQKGFHQLSARLKEEAQEPTRFKTTEEE